MMKKKMLALLLVSAITLPVTACGDGSPKETAGGTGTGETTQKTEPAATESGGAGGKTKASSDEIVEIIWQYPTTGNLGSGFQDMEDALNEMMERDIGVHVTFEPTGLMDSQQNAMLMVSAGEQLDICLTAFTSIGPLVSGNLIVPLDNLVTVYGQGLVESGVLLENGKYAGKQYGIPPAESLRKGYCYLGKKSYFDKYNIEIDESKYYTLEEIAEIFEVIKAGEGDNFYCMVPWNTTPEPMNYGYIEYDKVGGSLAEGVLMLNRSFEDLTLYNMFDTEEYERYAYLMYDWAQKGYISPDAAVTTEAPDLLAASDIYLGTFYWDEPTVATEYSATIGTELVKVPMIDGYMVNGGGAGCQWSIPITSKNPEKAMQALNYLYSNPEANWIVSFGLEGQTYEVVEETDRGTQIRYLSEKTETLPYFNAYGLWGSRFTDLAVAPTPADKGMVCREYHDALPDNRKSPALGYNFVQDNVSSEIAAVTTVIEQYTPSINCGALEPEQALADFRSALEAAGINKIIEENQRQMDEWSASQK